MDPKIKELLVLIMSWLTGIGLTVTGVFLPDMRSYLLPIGITIMLTALGLDLGFNFIPDAKQSIAERKFSLEKERNSLEMHTKGFVELPPENTTAPSLDKTVKGVEGFFKKIAPPEEPKEEPKPPFPLSSE